MASELIDTGSDGLLQSVAYIGARGEVYDGSYSLVGHLGCREGVIRDPQKVSVLRRVEELLSIMRLPPDPASFATEEAFVLATRGWKSRARSIGEFVRLPVLLPQSHEDAVGLPTMEANGDMGIAPLCLAEPRLDDYNTFDAYKVAISRWSRLCSSQEVIPPHLSELASRAEPPVPVGFFGALHFVMNCNLAGGTHIGPHKLDGAEKASFGQWNRPQVHRDESGATSRDDIAAETLDTPKLAALGPKGSRWEMLDDATQRRLRRVIADVLWRGLAYRERHDLLVPPPVARMHGTFARPSIQCWISLIPVEPSPEIREAEQATHGSGRADAPPSIEGRLLYFEGPDVGEPENIDFQRLDNPGVPEYVSSLRKAIEWRLFLSTFDELQAWYNPLVSEKAHSESRRRVLRVLSRSAVFSVVELRTILTSDQFLDRFCEMLTEPFRENVSRQTTGGTTNLTVFNTMASGLTGWKDVERLLYVMTDSTNRLAHAKLATFLLHLFGNFGSFGASLLRSTLGSAGHTSLWRLCQALSFFVPRAVPKFDPCWPDFVAQVAGSKPRDLVLLVHRYKYAAIASYCLMDYQEQLAGLPPDIARRFGGLCSAAQCSSSVSAIVALHKAWLDEISRLVSPAVGSSLIRGAMHRNPDVSEPCVSTLVWLCGRWESPILHSLKGAETNLIGHVRSMATSKYSHVRTASRTLYRLFEQKGWLLEYLLSTYSANTATFIQDLLSDSSVISSAVTRAMSSVLRKVARSNDRNAIRFLFSNNVFKQLTGYVAGVALRGRTAPGQTEETEHDPRLEYATDFLAEFARYAQEMRLIEGSPENAGGLGGTKLHLTKDDTLALCETCVALRASEAKACAIRCLRHLLKTGSLFMDVRQDPTFFQRVLDLCRDGSSIEANRESWRLFFQLVRYHPHTIDFLIRHNYLGPILNLCSISSNHVVIGHSLHYLTKIFRLPQNEKSREARSKTTVPEETSRTFNRGIRSLTDFFVKRHIFIKVHMIYKRYSKQSSGLAFQKLAQFYFTLATLPACQALLDDAKRNQEYRQGIDTVAKMFAGDTT